MRWSGWYGRELPLGFSNGVPIYTGERTPGIIEASDRGQDAPPYEAEATRPPLGTRVARWFFLGLASALLTLGRAAGAIDRLLARGAKRLSSLPPP